MSALTEPTGVAAGTLEAIARGAAALDADPAFPEAAFERLAADGALALTAGDRHPGRAREWAAVRAVARADGSVGGSSRATSTASSGSPSPRPSRCAPPSSPRSARAGCGSASGAPTRPPARASRPGSSRPARDSR
jgi:hypothetical protein